MNTMVGMQASAHSPMEDSVSELMKSDEPLCLEGIDDFGDDFDPDELLKSPLFNESTTSANLDESQGSEDEFGTFAATTEEEDEGAGAAAASMNNSMNGSFQSRSSYTGVDVSKPNNSANNSSSSLYSPRNSMHQAPVVKPPAGGGAPYMAPFNMNLQSPGVAQALESSNSQQAQEQNNMYDMDQKPAAVDRSNSSNSFQQMQQMQQQLASASIGQQQQFSSPGQPNKLMRRLSDSSNYAQRQSFSEDMSMSSQYNNGNAMSQISESSNCTNSNHMDNSHHRSSPVRGMNQHGSPRKVPARAPSRRSQSETTSPFRRGSLQSLSEHASLNVTENANSAQLQQLQQLQRMRSAASGNDFGLSQSMHGGSFGGGGMPSVAAANNNSNSNASLLNNSFHGGDSLSSASFHGGMAASNFNPGGLQSSGNVSIATPGMDNMKGRESFGTTSTQGSSQGSDAPATVNEVMEKLCESMKRSAMSRSMVKQMSGRNLSRQNSGMLLRQGSNRSLMDESSHRGSAAVPIRRMSMTKHQVHRPERGVYRQNSNQGLNGYSNHGNISIQFDTRNVGNF